MWPYTEMCDFLWVYPEDGDGIKTLLSACVTESHRWRVALLLRIWEILGSDSRKETGCPDCSFGRVCEIAKSDYYLRHACPSVCPSIRPHRMTRLTLDDFFL